MQKSKTPLYFGIFGALLIAAGLFFYRGSQNREATEAVPLKPSQVDFAKGNHFPAESKQATPPVVTERPKLNLETPQGFSAVETKQWTVFQEIVNSRNDNDPRIDQELKTLSPKMHENLIKAYQQLPMENRNSRGLIAFLIARDLQSTRDVEFLKSIYQEQPCMSMGDCSKSETTADPHAEATNQTSLNYPQLAGLYQLEQQLERNPNLLNNPEMRQEIADLLREARQFPGSSLQARAEDIQKKYGL
jgi:hypothetical protein